MVESDTLSLEIWTLKKLTFFKKAAILWFRNCDCKDNSLNFTSSLNRKKNTVKEHSKWSFWNGMVCSL